MIRLINHRYGIVSALVIVAVSVGTALVLLTDWLITLRDPLVQ